MHYTECIQELMSLVILRQAGKNFILVPNGGHLSEHFGLFYLQLQTKIRKNGLQRQNTIAKVV